MLALSRLVRQHYSAEVGTVCLVTCRGEKKFQEKYRIRTTHSHCRRHLLDYTDYQLSNFLTNFQMAVNSPISLMFMHPFILYELLSHCSGSGKAVVNFEFSVEGLWVMKHLAMLRNYVNVMSLMQVLPLGLTGLF